MQKIRPIQTLLCISPILIIFLLYMYKRQEKGLYNQNGQKLNLKNHVFVDLGANIGDSIRYFVDEDKENSVDIKGYAAKNPLINWEIYAVEANPFFNTHLDELKLYCEKLGHQVSLYKQTAAWIKNEKLTFYLDTVNPQHNYWGSSLKKNGPDVRNSNYSNVKVNGIDVSEMLKKYTKNDEVIMKIDIEGTEYELLEHLMKQKTLDLIDMIAIEFHPSRKEDREKEEAFKSYFKRKKIKFVQWS